MIYLQNKKGEKFKFNYAVDAREALQSGEYFELDEEQKLTEKIKENLKKEMKSEKKILKNLDKGENEG